MINLFSLGHFLQWMFVGYLFPIKWILFFVISIGWEFIELKLPFEFAIESINNAKLVCERLGVPHYTIDFTSDFKEKVIDDFLLSNEVRKDQIELHIMSYKQRLAKEMGFKESEIDNRHLEPFLSLVMSKPSYMKSVFSAIESGWDSWEMFRREGLKISDDSFDIFRDFMLQ